MRTFIRLLSFSKPYIFVLIIAIISSFIYGIFNAASLWIIGTLIGTLFGSIITPSPPIKEFNSFNQRIEYFFNNIISSDDPLIQLKMVCICLFLSFFFKNIFFFINWTSLAFVQLNMIKDLRNKFYSSIQQFSLSFFDRNKTGEILSIMLNDISLIKIAFNRSFQTILHELVGMSILIYMLFLINPSLTSLVFFTVPISGYIIIKIGQSIKRKVKRSSEQIANIVSYAEEKIIGIKIVKAFNMTLTEINNFYNYNYKFYKYQFSYQRLYGLTTPINDIIGVILATFLLWYGGQQVLIDNSMTSDDFMRFIIFLFAMLQPARKLGNSMAALQSGLAAAERLFYMIDKPFNQKSNNKLCKIEKFSQYIEIKNLSFSYSSSSKNVLSNINLKIKKGEKIAFVGESGSGKTTLTNLLLKFYKSDSGNLFIDNLDFNKIDTVSIRNLIGLVTQDSILFNDTIKNNISYGSSNINDESIVESAKIANIDDFVNSLNKGYDTIVGERGNLLSGGQKQRLSIARAILKNPSILIFDEATSSLDSESEYKVQDAINKLLKDRTVIMIAHRLTTIKNADRICVFDKGKIVEMGTHNQLIEKHSYYSKLYNMQFKEH